LRYLQHTASRGNTCGGDDLRLDGFNDANHPPTYPSGCRGAKGFVFFL
jgi:hypothetical protein